MVSVSLCTSCTPYPSTEVEIIRSIALLHMPHLSIYYGSDLWFDDSDARPPSPSPEDNVESGGGSLDTASADDSGLSSFLGHINL